MTRVHRIATSNPALQATLLLALSVAAADATENAGAVTEPHPESGMTSGENARADPGSASERAQDAGGPGQAEVDEMIRVSVVRVLTDDPQLEIVDLDVAVDRGTITLYGRVATPAEKHLAARYADDVIGSQGVVNALKVIPGLDRLTPPD